MDVGTRNSPPRIRPVWLPSDNQLAGVNAGVWWDAVAIDGPLGAAVAEELRTGPDECGPIAVAHRGAVPRWYFLTPAGAARDWRAPGTLLLGDGCRIGLPGNPTSTVHAAS